MADNTTINRGTDGDTIATDDISGVKHQKVKMEFGADGTATEVSSIDPLPVIVAASGPAFLQDVNSKSTMESVLDELRLLNFHLSTITGNDIEPGGF